MRTALKITFETAEKEMGNVERKEMTLDSLEFDGVQTSGQRVAKQALDAWKTGNVSLTRDALKKLVASYEQDPAEFEYLVPFAAVGTQLTTELETIEPLDCRCGDHIVWARHREALLLETLVDAIGRVLPEGLAWRNALRRYNSAVAKDFMREARWSASSYSDLPFLIQQLDALGRLDLESAIVTELSDTREDLLSPVILGEMLVTEVAEIPTAIPARQEVAKGGWLKGKGFKLAS